MGRPAGCGSDGGAMEVPPPPCEVHHCKNFVACGLRGLACTAYAEYVKRGTAPAPTTPTAAIFDKLGIPLAAHLAQRKRPESDTPIKLRTLA
jgi:hypothetical protein